MSCDKMFLLLIGQVLHGSGGLLPREEVMNMNVSWTELLAFCLVILEVIKLLVQIKKK